MFSFADRATKIVIAESHQYSILYSRALSMANRREYGIAYEKYIPDDDEHFDDGITLIQKHFIMMKRGTEITY